MGEGALDSFKYVNFIVIQFACEYVYAKDELDKSLIMQEHVVQS